MPEEQPKEEVKVETPTHEVSNPSDIQTPKKKNTRKFILFGIFGVLVLVLIGMIVWNARPTKLSYDSTSEIAKELDGEEMEVQPTVKPIPSPTAIFPQIDKSDWVSYRNLSLGISLKHPKDWSVKEMNGSVSIMPPSETCDRFCNVSVERQFVIHTENLKEKTLEKYINEYYEKNLPEDLKLSKSYLEGGAKEYVDLLRLNGFSANSLVGRSTPGACERTLFFASWNDKVTLIDVNCSELRTSDLLSTLNLMYIPESDLPIYPGAEIEKTVKTPNCTNFSENDAGLAKSYQKCDSIQYNYSSSEDFESVVDWYETDKSKSGWKLTGGAGDGGGERYGHLSNGKLSYWILISNDGDTGASFEIRIPIVK